MAILPVPLVGGLSALIQEELGFGDAQLGASIAAFYVAAAVLAAPAGRVAEVVGPRNVAWVGLACIVIALLGIGLVADGWMGLASFLAVAGVGHALTLLAVGVLLTRAIRRTRQGLAFGLSQAAAPLAALLAGLSVPTIALTLGWHVVFVVCAGLAVVAALIIPRSAPITAKRDEHRAADAPIEGLVLLAVAMAFASAGGNSTVVFVVGSTINFGFTTAEAGLVLSLASAVGLTVRIVAGWFGDRIGGDGIGLLAGVVAVGAIGYVGLATLDAVPVALMATILAVGGGWGWPGLMLLAATRSSPSAPGVALGVVTLGGLVGAVIGPITFGAIAEAASYDMAWLFVAILAVASIALILVSGRWMRRYRMERPAGADASYLAG